MPTATMNDTIDIEQHVQVVIDQLRRESDFLDDAIESCENLTKLLLPSRPENGDQSRPVEPDRTRAFALQRMKEMDVAIHEKFQPILAGREAMQMALQSFSTDPGAAPSLTRFAVLVHEPVRSELKQRRIDLKKKWFEFQAIMTGNQAILAYDLEFSQRLIADVTGVATVAAGYNANGQMNRTNTSSLLRKDC